MILVVRQCIFFWFLTPSTWTNYRTASQPLQFDSVWTFSNCHQLQTNHMWCGSSCRQHNKIIVYSARKAIFSASLMNPLNMGIIPTGFRSKHSTHTNNLLQLTRNISYKFECVVFQPCGSQHLLQHHEDLIGIKGLALLCLWVTQHKLLHTINVSCSKVTYGVSQGLLLLFCV